MAEWNEIDEAVAAIRATGNDQFALLKCTSAYPAPLAEMNLRVLPRLAERYGVPVGLSDHSPGHTAGRGGSRARSVDYREALHARPSSRRP